MARTAAAHRRLSEAAGSVFADLTELETAVDEWTSDAASAEAAHGHINSWDVSGVEDLSALFSYKRSFNDDIDDWDTSQVTTLYRTFYVGAPQHRPHPPCLATAPSPSRRVVRRRRITMRRGVALPPLRAPPSPRLRLAAPVVGCRGV